jgi:hypothetical protein
MMEQSLLMASFEQQAAPALPIFQYKSLDDEEADFGVDNVNGSSVSNYRTNEEGAATEPEEGAEMELSPTAPLPIPASDEMEEGQI